MKNNSSINSPWHKESFDKFINETLPSLIAKRLPLADYSISPNDTYSCKLNISVADVKVEYDILQPDVDGMFKVDEKPYVVVPIASSAHLDKATVKCVGEQLYDYVEAHLGEAANDLPWDEQLVRAWLPMDTWIRQLVIAPGLDLTPCRPIGQPLDTRNTLASRTHLRRIHIFEPEDVITSGQFGRVCPFEVPEGPNIGRVLSLALGATIKNGRIEIIDDRPEAALGLTASMVPFLEHNDANRQTFGVNMMRQWIVPNTPESALVQTGNEPDEPGTWCGRNLLTAFVSAGADTFEDSILISETGAKKLNEGYDCAVNVGDKISNRHGTKGVISRILPDSKMPHMPNGTPVDLVYSFIGIHARLNFGQIREAVMGNIAQAEGQPAIVPPFHSPSEEELIDRLKKVGLPADGMQFLTFAGKKMQRPSIVGRVYWGRTVHTAADKIHACTNGPRCNLQGMLEYFALRDMGCYANIQSYFNTCSNDRKDADDFVRTVENGAVEQAGAPSPKFAELQRRLSAAYIQTKLTESGLEFSMAPPTSGSLKLAQNVPHPWLPSQSLHEIGVLEDLPEYSAVVDANTALERTISGNSPDSLRQKAYAELVSRVNAFFKALIPSDEDLVNAFFLGDPKQFRLRFHNQVMFSGRTVLALGTDLHLDELGLAEEIAWAIFEPLVVRELKDKKQVKSRSEAATKALDNIMSRSWVILDRAPTLINTALIAFRPKRIPEKVIRIHPLVCFLMNADFDGDQAAVFLPITEDAQREAAEKLSLAGHLNRDPNLYGLKLLTHEAVWGLADLSLKPGGLDQIKQLAQVDLTMTTPIDRQLIAEMIRNKLQQDGVNSTIELMERLFDLGMKAAQESGASINPFIGKGIMSDMPKDNDSESWDAYTEMISDQLESRNDYDSTDIGPQLLAIKTEARGSIRSLIRLIGASGIVKDSSDQDVVIEHGLNQGFTPQETFACVAGARRGLAAISANMVRSGYGAKEQAGPKGFGVLARAMRSSKPGEVFARAAATNEIDPLTDLDSRLFTGLPPLA